MGKEKFLAFTAWLFYKIWAATWRQALVKSAAYIQDIKSEKPIIFAMWHGDELAAISFSKHFRLATLTSTSKDGEIMNSVLTRLGFETSRGSSTRGGVRALKGLVKLCRNGRIAVVPVDGPKGPIYKAKPGVFELSRLTGAQIFPVSLAASKKFIFEKSWNKAYLPLPFSKVVMTIGEPLAAVTKEQDPKSNELAQSLESLIDATSKLSLSAIAAPSGK